MARYPRDPNYVPSGGGVSTVDGVTNITFYVDPTTHRLLVSDALSGDVITVGGADLTPLFAPISASGNGDNTLVAAVSSKRIRVLQGLLIASNTVNVFFRDGTAGTAVTGTMNV